MKLYLQKSALVQSIFFYFLILQISKHKKEHQSPYFAACKGFVSEYQRQNISTARATARAKLIKSRKSRNPRDSSKVRRAENKYFGGSLLSSLRKLFARRARKNAFYKWERGSWALKRRQNQKILLLAKICFDTAENESCKISLIERCSCAACPAPACAEFLRRPL